MKKFNDFCKKKTKQKDRSDVIILDQYKAGIVFNKRGLSSLVLDRFFLAKRNSKDAQRLTFLDDFDGSFA